MNQKANVIYKVLTIILLIALVFSSATNYSRAAVKCKSVKMNVNNGTIGIGEVLSLNLRI